MNIDKFIKESLRNIDYQMEEIEAMQQDADEMLELIDKQIYELMDVGA